MYKSRRVPFSLFVNIPLTTPRINFRISECLHRFSIDLIIIFSTKNGNSKKNTLGPYWSFSLKAVNPSRIVEGGSKAIFGHGQEIFGPWPKVALHFFVVSLAWKCDFPEIFTGKIYFWKKMLKTNLKFVSSHFQANKTIKKLGHFWPSCRAMAKRFLVNGHGRKWPWTSPPIVERVCDQPQLIKHSLYFILKKKVCLKRTFHLEVRSIASL